MQLALRIIAILSFVVAILWVILDPGFEPLLAFLAGVSSLLASLAIERSKDPKQTETLDERNRRVMLDHVENFWVKGILEKSLHGAALLELGIREDPGAVRYPWTIKRESTGEPLPAGKPMLAIFHEIGAGRSLLVLGAPGAGKTTMLLELARQLVERARHDVAEPIPVVFNLASWTEKHEVADWLAEQLNLVYSVPKKIAPSWVQGNKMLLLLDGLDEVKEDRRARCVQAINQFRTEHGLTSLVVCSRSAEYSAINAKLAFEGAITLQPLTSEQVDTYIDRFGERLSVVQVLLRKDRSLRELAETPLTLSIMTLAYKDIRADDLLGLGTIEAQRKHLFDTYIDRMFERSTRSASSPFTKPDTLHYLGWLARKMIQQNVTTYQIESMQPLWLGEESLHRLYRLYVGLSIGLSAGLMLGLLFTLLMRLIGTASAAVPVGLTTAIIGGLLGGGLSWKKDRIILNDRLKWSWKEFWFALLFGFSLGVFMGTIAWLYVAVSGRLSEELIDRIRILWFLLLFPGSLVGLWFGLTSGFDSEQVEETTYPGQRVKQSSLNSLIVAFIHALSLVFLMGLLSGVVYGLVFGPLTGLQIGLRVGLLTGLFGGLAFGMFDFHPVLQHYFLRRVLARYDLLPRQLIPFLEYCVSLIFLRRAGGSYIFVHRLLMEHFAEMGTPEGEPPGDVPRIKERVDPPSGGIPPLLPP